MSGSQCGHGMEWPDKPELCGKALDMLHKSDEAETGADRNSELR